jgi:hypothetical protein
MYSVYQHWDPLKTCIVGKSYPPEFYSWIKNPTTRTIFERIAQETEEDFQSLIKLLKKFNVDVLRPDIPSDRELLFDTFNNTFVPPPMTPRDDFGMYGNTLIYSALTISDFYTNHKLDGLPEVFTYADAAEHIPKLGNDLNFNSDDFNILTPSTPNGDNAFYENIFTSVNDDCNVIKLNNGANTSTAFNVRIGKDIITAQSDACDNLNDLINANNDYRIHNTNQFYHLDGVFCPVVPGLIISLNDIKDFNNTLPGWEVVYLHDQSWDKIKPFLDLKRKNKGKWWIPGEEYNDDVIDVVDTWLSKWVGYVEETVFDVNMLVIDEKNVIVNNYNKVVFDALERYGVTPHICNFRHRYFWDGGLHCITTDLDREGEIKDYFPQRNQ